MTSAGRIAGTSPCPRGCSSSTDSLEAHLGGAMPTTAPIAPTTRPARYVEADCRVDDFAALVDQSTNLADYPHAADVQRNVLIYDSAALRASLKSERDRLEVEAEPVRALTDAPGVVAFKGAFPDTVVTARATSVFE